MNAWGLLLVWTALQVSMFCLAAIGLYAVARRRGPAAGAWATGTALAVSVVIAGLALAPWPRWWSPEAGEATTQVSTEPDRTTATFVASETTGAQVPRALSNSDEVSPSTVAPHNSAAEPQPASPPGWQAILSRLQLDVSRASADLSKRQWGWPAWLAVVILAGCSVALVRLVVAVWAAHHYCRQARAVTDPSILRLLDEVREQLACARPIELRETSGMFSPSTLGWLRPAIVLPADWRTWSEGQRRAVLAHEVAHVVRGDFVVWLVGQLGVVLHFYNPLVHLLARRLRLEQEMAADVCGAQLSGGRQFYLTTLAQMALRRNDPPLAWAARPFLPTRGTLMRRVEMLHQRKDLPSLVVSPARQTTLVAMLLFVAVLLVGLRPPATSAQEEAAATTTSGNVVPAQPFDLDFVPHDAYFVLALRPAELVRIKGLDAVRLMLEEFGVFEPVGLPLAEIEECKFVVGHINGVRSWSMLVLRGKKPHDWSKVAAYFAGETKEVIGDGEKYYQSTAERSGNLSCYWLPDDRTIVLGPADIVTRTFSLRGNFNEPDWAAGWRADATGPAALMVKADVVQAIFNSLMLNGGDVTGNLTDEADLIFLASHASDGALDVTGTMQCKSAASAERARKLVEAAMVGFGQFVQKTRPPQPAAFDLLAQVAGASKFEVQGSSLASHSRVDFKVDKEAFKTQLNSARLAARRNASQNKLRMLGIALQNYHDAYKRFPPAVLIGPDGKTPYSWRVALLPFLEKNDLYQSYRRDEPWDSEHNKKLIAEAADLFSVPVENGTSDCGYFMVTGPDTLNDPARPRTRIRDIIDGTSNTIGLVEAKRAIPWTKPEDIEYDPAKPLPKLGGHFEGGYHVGAMDASVHFIPDNIDEDTLRALLTAQGREATGFPDR